MAFRVYILGCADGSYYVRHTDNLEHRIEQHQSGALGRYTRKRHPVRMVYSQEFSTREEAFAAERQIKGWSRKKKEALMAGDWEGLRRLARGRQRVSAHPSTGSG
jgi:predicted GIY-YIG superfamily endonuclease